ncbi:MAG: hypothetical protein IGR92_09140 [Leptolyngbyaceae cyanobacterium T60_A2020_046]|nr:hypothetical protein [Leptolyngbyaceae cyanobacterium T60_A2020_046]
MSTLLNFFNFFIDKSVEIVAWGTLSKGAIALIIPTLEEPASGGRARQEQVRTVDGQTATIAICVVLGPLTSTTQGQAIKQTRNDFI